MNIVHLDFTGPFTDDAAYQENILPAINVLDGHNVTFVAEKTKWSDGKRVELSDNEPCEYSLSNGVHVIRLGYRKILSGFITDKIRAPKGLSSLLNQMKPDVIFVHCLQTWAIIAICRYARKNEGVRLYADSHSDQYNSGRGFLSKYILHGLFYRKLALYAEKYVEKIFYISLECKAFLIERYHIQSDKLEFMPLGGIPVPSEEKMKHRTEFREEYTIPEEDIILIHAGKMDKLKKTLEILRTFERFKGDMFKLVLVGAFNPEIEREAKEIIERDKRILYLGWKPADELEKYLCAADLYLQPGSQSATAQHALCCGLPVVLAKVPSYEIFVKDNGWLIKDVEELSFILQDILENPKILHQMSLESQMISDEYLDYRKLARKFTV